MAGPRPDRGRAAAARQKTSRRAFRLQRLQSLVSARSWRGASIRARVTLALVGVVALIAPQIVLTVVYLVDLFEQGARVDRLSAAVQGVDALRDDATAVFLAGFPRAPEDLDGQLAQLEALASRTDALATRLRAQAPPGTTRDGSFAHHAERLDAFSTLTRGHGARLEAAFRALSLRPPLSSELAQTLGATAETLDVTARAWAAGGVEPTAAEQAARLDWLQRYVAALLPTLTGALVGDTLGLGEADAAWLVAAERARQSAGRTLAPLGELKAALASDNAAAGRAITRDVDEANRYLITLVLLTLVYVTVIIVVLPRRLVRPLEHLVSVMDGVGRGQLEARARVVGEDEMGAVSGSLNRLLDRVAVFDALKRDRIYEDRHRIAALAAMVDAPVAFVDTRLRLEHANPAFRALFALSEGGASYEDLPLLDRISGPDAGALRDCLEGALSGRRSVIGVPLRLTAGGDDGPRSLALTATPGRDRQGRIAYLLLRLDES